MPVLFGSPDFTSRRHNKPWKTGASASNWRRVFLKSFVCNNGVAIFIKVPTKSRLVSFHCSLIHKWHEQDRVTRMQEMRQISLIFMKTTESSYETRWWNADISFSRHQSMKQTSKSLPPSTMTRLTFAWSRIRPVICNCFAFISTLNFLAGCDNDFNLQIWASLGKTSDTVSLYNEWGCVIFINWSYCFLLQISHLSSEITQFH